MNSTHTDAQCVRLRTFAEVAESSGMRQERYDMRLLASLTFAQQKAFRWLAVNASGYRSGADRAMTAKLRSLRDTGLAESEPTQPVTWFLTDEGLALREPRAD